MALDLSDIQGNPLRGYRLPFARYVFVNLTDPEAARALMGRICMHITNAEIWTEGKPSSTLNMALSRTALRALALPRATIEGMPDAFLEGMRARADILGDTGRSAPEHWDEVWRNHVDVMFSINAQTSEARKERFEWLSSCINAGGGEIVGHQDAGVLQVNGKFLRTEHFGYSDGISQPIFDRSPQSQSKITAASSPQHPGSGKLGADGWESIATWEFILGHPNESKELPATPKPPIFTHSGSFMVYRKLRQNVAAFRAYFEEWDARYPGGAEKLRAKFVGRWSDGTPLALSPETSNQDISSDPMRVNDFIYNDDSEGLKCPLGAHLRRMNPRDSMGFGSDLTRIRRILRRGLPYGTWADENVPVDNTDRGVVFMALNASITRQFEFVAEAMGELRQRLPLGRGARPCYWKLRSWYIHYSRRYLKRGRTLFCKDIPAFVECAGGDYFFVPSITSIRMMVEGSIDPR
ncbi:MAG: hypothetical protein OXC60_02965 [Litoreibacter sp.]|nr:hypothetical protein [Litoreibacter sp.]